MMKKFIYNAVISLSFLFAFVACMSDDGNYDYDYDGAPKIIIDTVGVRTEFFEMLNADWSVGERIYWEPNVTFENGDADRLEYAWIALKLSNYQYVPEQVGNTSVYGTPDTICTTKALDFIVDFEAGGHYRIYCQVSDPMTGLSANLMVSNYIVIPAPSGTYYGIYCLPEKDGQLDIFVMIIPRPVILGFCYNMNIWGTQNEYRTV